MLSHLSISQFRNIKKISFQPSEGLNLFLGENGSGKTSILEAVYLLALGRSFRTRTLKNIIQIDQEELQVIARTQMEVPIGLEFSNAFGLQIRLNSTPLRKLSDLAFQLPLQYISANCHQFFELGPKFRRQLLDWGLFHVEPNFNSTWQAYKKIIKQRNATLKQKKNIDEITMWDSQFVQYAETINGYRQKYLNRLVEKFKLHFARLCPEFNKATFTLRYLKGWNKEAQLADVIAENVDRDMHLTYTRNGSHAADWGIKINNMNPSELLSRGQQKLFFIAICMAQAELAMQTREDKSILVIDDISSELDEQHQINVINMLNEQSLQCYISSTNIALTAEINDQNGKVFHVKQGRFLSET